MLKASLLFALSARSCARFAPRHKMTFCKERSSTRLAAASPGPAFNSCSRIGSCLPSSRMPPAHSAWTWQS